MSRFSWLTAGPIAHRGLHDADAGIEENSSSAIEAAMANAYAIELDVQLSADGDAIVFHDETLDRLTRESGDVVSLTSDELCSIAYSHGPDRISRLQDALDQIDGRVPLVIEIKSLWNNVGPLERRVAELLAGYRGDVAVMSFDPRTVQEIRRIAPSLTRGIVACAFSNPANWPELSPWQRFSMRHVLHVFKTRPHFISYDAEDLPAPAPGIARAVGLPVITWTIRSEEERKRALRWCDQVTFEGFMA